MAGIRIEDINHFPPELSPNAVRVLGALKYLVRNSPDIKAKLIQVQKNVANDIPLAKDYMAALDELVSAELIAITNEGGRFQDDLSLTKLGVER